MTMTSGPGDVDLAEAVDGSVEVDPTAAVCLFRSLADPARLTILRHLALGEHRVVDLTNHVGLAQSTTSAHLACLRDCGLVVGVPVGRNVRYELSDPKLAHALEDLLGTILTVEPVCRCGTPECAAEALADDATTQEIPV